MYYSITALYFTVKFLGIIIWKRDVLLYNGIYYIMPYDFMITGYL